MNECPLYFFFIVQMKCTFNGAQFGPLRKWLFVVHFEFFFFRSLARTFRFYFFYVTFFAFIRHAVCM